MGTCRSQHSAISAIQLNYCTQYSNTKRKRPRPRRPSPVSPFQMSPPSKKEHAALPESCRNLCFTWYACAASQSSRRQICLCQPHLVKAHWASIGFYLLRLGRLRLRPLLPLAVTAPSSRRALSRERNRCTMVTKLGRSSGRREMQFAYRARSSAGQSAGSGVPPSAVGGLPDRTATSTCSSEARSSAQPYGHPQFFPSNVRSS
mmetsp:Transcript_39804/g.90271  ORF Transcript_39804/g.90271 Transcript_39804/m.90271 type:complete len:204 (+) Transcript_39804:135-746(+)